MNGRCTWPGEALLANYFVLRLSPSLPLFESVSYSSCIWISGTSALLTNVKPTACNSWTSRECSVIGVRRDSLPEVEGSAKLKCSVIGVGRDGSPEVENSEENPHKCIVADSAWSKQLVVSFPLYPLSFNFSQFVDEQRYSFPSIASSIIHLSLKPAANWWTCSAHLLFVTSWIDKLS